MNKLVVGSRESKLAIAQTKLVIAQLQKEDPTLEVEIKTFKTSGDRLQTQSVDMVTNKGLFVKELEEALCEEKIDFAVHSLKDIPMEVPEKLPIVAMPKRGDPRDVVVFKKGCFDGLNHFRNMRVGTSSIRRRVQLQALYKEARVEEVRGNIITRLRKLEDGEFDAILLAAAGLQRVGLENRIGMYFETDEILPAAGQGVLAIQARKETDASLLQAINDQETAMIATAERAYVKELGGSCTSPVAAYGQIKNNKLYLSGLFYREDTNHFYKETIIADKEDPEASGVSFAKYMRKRYRS
ncbi:MAG: hydroxymethylbilane synthase [bacterium]|nr:hydroxymethylbilane synthase [bacterium]